MAQAGEIVQEFKIIDNMTSRLLVICRTVQQLTSLCNRLTGTSYSINVNTAGIASATRQADELLERMNRLGDSPPPPPPLMPLPPPPPSPPGPVPPRVSDSLRTLGSSYRDAHNASRRLNDATGTLRGGLRNIMAGLGGVGTNLDAVRERLDITGGAANSLGSKIASLGIKFLILKAAIATAKKMLINSLETQRLDFQVTAILGSDSADKLKEQLSATQSVITVNARMQIASGFSGITKDVNELTKLVNLTERAMARTGKTSEQVGFSIKEAMAGDFRSLRDTMDLSKADIEPLKAAVESGKDFSKVLDELFTKRGASQGVLDAFAESGAGKVDNLKTTITDLLSIKGETFLASVIPIVDKLQKIIDSTEFSQLLSGIAIVFGTIAQVASFAIDIILKVIGFMKEIAKWVQENITILTILGIVAGAFWLITQSGAIIAIVQLGLLKLAYFLLHGAYVIVTGAAAFFNAVLNANPISIIIIAVIALVAILVYLALKFESIGSTFANVCGSIAGWVYWVAAEIKNGFNTAINFVIDKINGLLGLINKIPGVSVPLVPKLGTTTAEERKAGSAKVKENVTGGITQGISDANKFLGGLKDKFNPKLAKAPNTAAPGGGGGALAPSGGGGGGGRSGGGGGSKSKEPIEITSEQLKALIDLQRRQILITNTTSRPIINVNVTQSGDTPKWNEDLLASSLADTVAESMRARGVIK